MIILDDTDKSVVGVLGLAKDTTDIVAVIFYADTNGTEFNEGEVDITFNGLTEIELVPAPALGYRRLVKAIAITNVDAIAQDVTLKLKHGAAYRTLRIKTLAVNESYVYTGDSEGLIGPKGDIGSTGAQGIQGVPGIQGIQGEIGATGAQGAKGDTGAAGSAGADGDDSYLYIAYASDASGTDFTMTFSAALNYIAIKNTTSPIANPQASDFTGLWKNYKGATGDTGAKGDTGNTGATGDTGLAGADGDNAYVYIAYASDDLGTNFTTTFSASLNYIAIKATTTAISSPQASDFTGLWFNYKGATGATGSTGATGEGVVTGGTTGQVLTKKSNTNYDTEWANAASGGGLGIRQTVLSSKLSSGLPAFITDPNDGLKVNIDTGSGASPVVIAFAAGFDILGPIDHIGAIESDTSISSLTDSTTNFLYAERNSGTGAITLGAVTVIPAYQDTAPSHAANQYWFSVPEMKMYLSNGTNTWTEKQVVFLGEAITSGGQVASVINYALRAGYTSSEVLTSASTAFSFSHNIGLLSTHLVMSAWARDVDNDHIIPYCNTPCYDYTAANNSFISADSSAERNVIKIRMPSVMLLYLDSAGNTHSVTAANKCGMTMSMKRNW